MTYPTAIQSALRASPGPTVDGTPLLPGDRIRGPDGDRVVRRTGQGSDRPGVDVFDPETGTQTTATPGEEWAHLEQSLGVVTALDPSGERQYVAVATCRARDCRLRWGSTPLGGTTVTLDEGSVSAPSPATLRDLIEDGPTLADALGDNWPSVAERLTDRIAALADRRDVGTTDRLSLRRPGVEIPTGDGDPVATVDGTTVAPGDRFVVVPDTTPFETAESTLAEGRCAVVLTDRTVFDLTTDERVEAGDSVLRRLHDRARTDGLHCRLLERDCHVDPIGRAQVHSVHVYRLGGPTEGVLLATETRAGDRPALEHPLALDCQRYSGREGVAATLRRPDRIGGFDAPVPSTLRERCRQMADRLDGGDPE